MIWLDFSLVVVASRLIVISGPISIVFYVHEKLICIIMVKRSTERAAMYETTSSLQTFQAYTEHVNE